MSEAKQWKVGDVVTLKSGGPKMTVVVLNGSVVTCGWFHRHSHVSLNLMLQSGRDLTWSHEDYRTLIVGHEALEEAAK